MRLAPRHFLLPRSRPSTYRRTTSMGTGHASVDKPSRPGRLTRWHRLACYADHARRIAVGRSACDPIAHIRYTFGSDPRSLSRHAVSVRLSERNAVEQDRPFWIARQHTLAIDHLSMGGVSPEPAV